MTSSAPAAVSVPTADGGMPALQWLPASGSGPGLIVVQEIFGVSPYIKSRCADLAELGYVVLAPELYWRLPDRTVDESREDVIDQGMALASQIDWDTAVSDATQALRHLRSQPEVVGGVGLIGFCFGGGLAFNVAAVDQPDVLVSYYGSALPGLLHLAPEVEAPSLHHFGLSDAFIPQAEVQRIREAVTAKPDVAFETYPEANHAFDNPHLSELHNPDASRAAWQKTVNFLADRLPIAAAAA